MSKNHLNTEALTTDFVRYVSSILAVRNQEFNALGCRNTLSFTTLTLLTLSSKDSVVIGLGREEAAFLKMDSATSSATLTFTT